MWVYYQTLRTDKEIYISISAMSKLENRCVGGDRLHLLVFYFSHHIANFLDILGSLMWARACKVGRVYLDETAVLLRGKTIKSRHVPGCWAGEKASAACC
jgi:hypothetical protein